jgi:hypothetical protein
MLFSILIGAAATLYFLVRAFIIKIKVLASGGSAGARGLARKNYVIYCEGRQYSDVFKPVLEEFEKRETELLYLSSAEDDPLLNAAWKYIKTEYIGEGNKAFARLNLLAADVVLMTTPALDVYQLKRSRGVKHYAHILHAPGDATMYRLFGIDYFDSVLLTGEYQARDIRALEAQRGLPEKRLPVTGCSYLDVYAEKAAALAAPGPGAAAKNAPFTVLVSPTWGPSGLLARYGERLLAPLAATGWHIIVRPHPQSKKSEAALLERLGGRFKDAPNVEWDYERENIHALARADVMISDFSGVIFDYTFLFDKPVLYVNQNIDLRPYDADDICSGPDGTTDLKKLWQFRALADFGIELKEEMFERIGEVLQSVSDNSELQAARARAKSQAWMYPHSAGRRIADFMVETRETIAVAESAGANIAVAESA